MTKKKQNRNDHYSCSSVDHQLLRNVNKENNVLTSSEKVAGWKLLFDGHSTSGWHLYNSKGHLQSGRLEMVNCFAILRINPVRVTW